MTLFLKEVQDIVKTARKRELDIVNQFDYETPIQKLLVATVQHIRQYAACGMDTLQVAKNSRHLFFVGNDHIHIQELIKVPDDEIYHQFWSRFEDAVADACAGFQITKDKYKMEICWAEEK